MNNLCRLCGVKKTKLKDLLSKKKLLEDINRYLQILIFEEDFLPHQICEPCERQMKRIVKYARTCQKTQREFHRWLRSEKAETPEAIPFEEHSSCGKLDQESLDTFEEHPFDIACVKVEPDIVEEYSTTSDFENSTPTVFALSLPEVTSNAGNTKDELGVEDDHRIEPKRWCSEEDAAIMQSLGERDLENDSDDDADTNASVQYVPHLMSRFENSVDHVTSTANDSCVDTTGTTFVDVSSDDIESKTSSHSLHTFIKKCRYGPQTYVISKNGNSDNWTSPRELALDANTLRCDVLKDALYTLSYDGKSQTFKICDSIYTFSGTDLTKPPILLQRFDMCGLPNYNRIYVCNANRASGSLGMTGDQGDGTFTPEEISRRIYAYNCERDKWFPVPPINEKIRRSGCMAGDNHLLYLFCGYYPNNSSYFPCMGILRAYDCRTERWQELLRSSKPFRDSECCMHKGKLYILGVDRECTTMSVFDPVAGKLVTEELNLTPRYDIRLVSCEDELWMCNGFNMRKYTGNRIPATRNPLVGLESISSHYLLDAFVQ